MRPLAPILLAALSSVPLLGSQVISEKTGDETPILGSFRAGVRALLCLQIASGLSRGPTDIMVMNEKQNWKIKYVFSMISNYIQWTNLQTNPERRSDDSAVPSTLFSELPVTPAPVLFRSLWEPSLTCTYTYFKNKANLRTIKDNQFRSALGRIKCRQPRPHQHSRGCAYLIIV